LQPSGAKIKIRRELYKIEVDNSRAGKLAFVEDNIGEGIAEDDTRGVLE
jgi:hypothetical protein